MQPLGIFAADLQLAPITWVKHPELRGDAYHSLDQLCEQAITHRVPLFLLGDIFDKSHPDAASVQEFCRQMQRMADACIDVYIIRGNHDYTDPPWPLVSSWPQWINGRTIELGGYRFYGLDFTNRGRLADALKEVPLGTDVLLAHQAWAEMQGIGATDGSFADIHHAVWMITGDYHVAGVWRGESASGPITVFSPGSTCMQALNEPPEKSCLLVCADKGGLQVNTLVLDTRRFYHYQVTTTELLDQLCAYFTQLPEIEDRPGLAGRAIFRVQFLDSLPDAYKRLMAALGEPNRKCHFFPEPQHTAPEQVMVQLSAEQIQAGGFDTLESGLVEMLQQGVITQELYDAAIRLLRAPDPKAEIAALFQEITDGRRILADRVEPSQDRPAHLLPSPS